MKSKKRLRENRGTRKVVIKHVEVKLQEENGNSETTINEKTMTILIDTVVVIEVITTEKIPEMLLKISDLDQILLNKNVSIS